MLNLGLVGFGYWGPNLARSFSQLDEVNLKYICDIEEKNLEKIKRSFPQVNATKDFSELLNDVSLKAIVIATSAVTHFQLAKKSLEASKHVFVEKPIALHSKEALELIHLAEKKKLLLMVGHLLIYHPAIEWIKEYIKKGEIGEVLYLYSQRLNLGRLRKDENVIWSLAPHDISVALFLLEEEPLEVIARGGSYLRYGVEDVAFLTLTFPGKKIANIHVSWLDPHKIRKLTIVGTKKMVVFDDMESSEKVRIYDKGVEPVSTFKPYSEALTLRFGDITIPSLKMKEPLTLECLHFINCIKEGKKPRSDGLQGLKVLKVLEAAQRSMNQGGQPVKMKETKI